MWYKKKALSSGGLLSHGPVLSAPNVAPGRFVTLIADESNQQFFLRNRFQFSVNVSEGPSGSPASYFSYASCHCLLTVSGRATGHGSCTVK